MITKHVVVLPYDEHWTRDFCEIKSEIQEALDQLALVIEHVGSTSVHGFQRNRLLILMSSLKITPCLTL